MSHTPPGYERSITLQLFCLLYGFVAEIQQRGLQYGMIAGYRIG